MRLDVAFIALVWLVACTLAQQFIVPPDLSESSLPDTILSYAFGQTMLAQWWTPWQTVTLKLNTCDQDKTFTLFTAQPNRNNYMFSLTTNLTGPCSGYSLSIIAVSDADGYPTKGLVLNSQHFKILNIPTAPSIVGAFTEPVTTGTGSSKITSTLTTTIRATTGTEKPSLITGLAGASSPSATGTSGDSASTTASSTSSGDKSSLPVGLGVGLGLGIPIIIAVLVGVWWIRRRRRRRRLATAARSPAIHESKSAAVQSEETRPEMPMNQSTAKSSELLGSAPHVSEAGSQPIRSADGKPSELEGETQHERHELSARDSYGDKR